MLWPSSDCTATTRQFPSPPRPRPRPVGPGYMSARPAVRWQGSSSGAVLHLARSHAATSRAASGRVRRHSVSRRLRRLQPPLSSRPQARSRRCAGAMRGGSSSNLPTSPLMRDGARRRRRSRRSRLRPSDAHRRALQHRAGDQRPVGRQAPGRAPGEVHSVGRRARRLDAH